MFDDIEMAERVVGWLKGGGGNPLMLEIRPTNRCNLQCPSCVSRGHPSQIPCGEELSERTYLRILDEAATLGVKYVQISGGGEPFVRKKSLLRIMSRIKHHGMRGFVITNGTLCDRHTVRKMIEFRWDAILFSIDAPTPELNDRLRSKKGCFKKTVSAIKELVRLKQLQSTEVPRIDLGPVLSHQNCHAVVDMVRFAVGLGVDNLHFQPVHVPDTEDGRLFRLTEDDKATLRESIPSAIGIAEENGLGTNLEDFDSTLLKNSDDPMKISQAYSSASTHPWLSLRCFSPWYYVGIHPDGAVGPCSIIDDASDVPNIRDGSLKHIWEGPWFQDFRRSLLENDLLEKCARCSGSNVMANNTIRERLRQVVL